MNVRLWLIPDLWTTGFPEILLQHFFVHTDAVIAHSQTTGLDRYLDFAFCDRKALRRTAHQDGIVRVLDIFAQKCLRRVIDFR